MENRGGLGGSPPNSNGLLIKFEKERVVGALPPNSNGSLIKYENERGVVSVIVMDIGISPHESQSS